MLPQANRASWMEGTEISIKYVDVNVDIAVLNLYPKKREKFEDNTDAYKYVYVYVGVFVGVCIRVYKRGLRKGIRIRL